MVSKYGSPIYILPLFSLLLSIMLHADKDVSSDFLFFSVFLDLQSIRDDEATTSMELIFFNVLTDVPITSRKT